MFKQLNEIVAMFAFCKQDQILCYYFYFNVHIMFEKFILGFLKTQIKTFYFNMFVFSEPAEPPIILSVYPKPTSIHVTWEEPVFTNGPLVAYRLTLVEANGPEPPKIKNMLTNGTKVLKDIFTSLQPATDYILKIAAWNIAGLGPEARTDIQTSKLTIGVSYNSL